MARKATGKVIEHEGKDGRGARRRDVSVSDTYTAERARLPLAFGEKLRKAPTHSKYGRPAPGRELVEDPDATEGEAGER